MDRYSRVVSYLKVALPLAALALLSTLFLISRTINTDPSIPFADFELENRLRGQQVTAPFFTGTTATGQEITIAATKALPAVVAKGPLPVTSKRRSSPPRAAVF